VNSQPENAESQQLLEPKHRATGHWSIQSVGDGRQLPLQVMRLTNDFENRNELGWAQNPDSADWVSSIGTKGRSIGD
jgi:hypothetical protein